MLIHNMLDVWASIDEYRSDSANCSTLHFRVSGDDYVSVSLFYSPHLSRSIAESLRDFSGERPDWYWNGCCLAVHDSIHRVSAVERQRESEGPGSFHIRLLIWQSGDFKSISCFRRG